MDLSILNSSTRMLHCEVRKWGAHSTLFQLKQKLQSRFHQFFKFFFLKSKQKLQLHFFSRLRYAKDGQAYSAENDTLIIQETVTKFIRGFPYHLSDGTISRYFWAGGVNNTNGVVSCRTL